MREESLPALALTLEALSPDCRFNSRIQAKNMFHGQTGTSLILSMPHKSVSWILGHFLVLNQAQGSLFPY